MLFIKGEKLPCKIITMLNLGLDIQTLILYTYKVFNKCIVFYEYGFKSCFVFNGKRKHVKLIH